VSVVSNQEQTVVQPTDNIRAQKANKTTFIDGQLKRDNVASNTFG